MLAVPGLHDHAHAEISQALAEEKRRLLRLAAMMHDVDVGLRANGHVADFTHEFDHALEPHREAHARSGLAAEHLDERVVATAAADRALGAELVGNPLENRVVVIVQAANKARIDLVLDPRGAHEFLKAIEERAAFVAEEIKKLGRRFNERLHIRILRVENTKRIRVEAALGVVVKHVLVGLEVSD